MKDFEKNYVYVLSVSNNEGNCIPSVHYSEEDALKELQELYNSSLEEWLDEDGNLIKEDKDGCVCPILDYEISLESKYAYITFVEDFTVNYEIYCVEVR